VRKIKDFEERSDPAREDHAASMVSASRGLRENVVREQYFGV